MSMIIDGILSIGSTTRTGACKVDALRADPVIRRALRITGVGGLLLGAASVFLISWYLFGFGGLEQIFWLFFWICLIPLLWGGMILLALGLLSQEAYETACDLEAWAAKHK